MGHTRPRVYGCRPLRQSGKKIQYARGDRIDFIRGEYVCVTYVRGGGARASEGEQTVEVDTSDDETGV